MDRLLEEYKGRIKLAYYHVTYSNHSFKAAQAAICAGAQGKYWEYHGRLFEKQREWSGASDPSPLFEGYARDLGLKMGGFKSCLGSEKVKEVLDKDKRAAVSRNVTSTPTIFIGGTRIVGAQPYDVYKSVIDGLPQKQ